MIDPNAERFGPLAGSAPTHLVVLLHGYGADGRDLIGLAPLLAEAMPGALFVAPDAPDPSAMGFGYQWFAIDWQGDRVAARQEAIPAARPALLDWLETLALEAGIGRDRIVLAGFSQGAMMALHCGLALDSPPLGILAFSGALVLPEGFVGRTAHPAVCLVHGSSDTVVPAALSAEAARVLEAAGLSVEHHVDPGVAHGISPDGLAIGKAFLARLARPL